MTLHSLISLIYHNDFLNLVFDPSLSENDKYDNYIDGCNFFSISDIPKTEYVYLSNFPLSSANTLSILNLNIRSIPKNLQYFVDNVVYHSDIKLNITGLTEIRLNQSISSLYNLPGYHLFVNARNVYGGGTAIYADSELEATLLSEFTISYDFIETVRIEVNFFLRKCVYMCVYRPPNGNFYQFLLFY